MLPWSPGLFASTILTAALLASGAGAAVSTPHFLIPTVIGFVAGNDWEPSVASDGVGNVYVVWAHFGGVPGCAGCGSPAALIEISRNGGSAFSAPRLIHSDSKAEIDFNVKVNATGAVFVSYLLGKSTVVQRSVDHGHTWTAPLVVSSGIRGGVTDKPGLAVRGSNVYVAFDLPQHMFVAASHDGGRSFTTVPVIPKGGTHGILSLNSGGVVAPDGTVFFSWVGVTQTGNALNLQQVLLTRSTDGGSTWKILPVDSSLPPGPACPTKCGWDYLGPQMVVAVDASGILYVLYNAGTAEFGAPSMWYRTSSDGGATWSGRTIISTDGTPSWHVFPAIDAGAAGNVKIAWMDNSTGAYNVWYRSSSDGGVTWSNETKVSHFRSGYSYVTHEGFAFPYGDYFILNLDAAGISHLAWGEGPNWVGPGNVLYAHST